MCGWTIRRRSRPCAAIGWATRRPRRACARSCVASRGGRGGGPIARSPARSCDARWRWWWRCAIGRRTSRRSSFTSRAAAPIPSAPVARCATGSPAPSCPTSGCVALIDEDGLYPRSRAASRRRGDARRSGRAARTRRARVRSGWPSPCGATTRAKVYDATVAPRAARRRGRAHATRRGAPSGCASSRPRPPASTRRGSVG